MPEPGTAGTGAAIALGAVTLTGSVLGLHYDALAIGFVAALFALLHTAPDPDLPRTPLRVFAFVAAGSFAAALFAPLAAVAVREYLDVVGKVDAEVLRMCCAGVIGATINAAIPALRGLLPAALDRIRALIGGGAR